MARQREFNMQVRFTTDDETHYEIVTECLKQQCQALNAQFLMLAGQGIKPPMIHLVSEDFIKGTEEIEWNDQQ